MGGDALDLGPEQERRRLTSAAAIVIDNLHRSGPTHDNPAIAGRILMEFNVQKLHPALGPGQRLMLTGSNIAAFSYQGSWDGGCALHSAAMAMAMLGRLSNPPRLTWRRGGAEVKFWKGAGPYYLSGITLDDLSTLIRELDWDLRPIACERANTEAIQFCERELSRGWPVVVSWRERHRAQEHAVLVVGVEGRKHGGRCGRIRC